MKAVPNPDEIQISFDDEDDGADEAEAAALIPEPEPTPEPEPAPTRDPISAVKIPEASSSTTISGTGAAVTHFLALDKCLPKRDYLEASWLLWDALVRN